MFPPYPLLHLPKQLKVKTLLGEAHKTYKHTTPEPNILAIWDKIIVGARVVAGQTGKLTKAFEKSQHYQSLVY
jgi:hypothetical protein